MLTEYYKNWPIEMDEHLASTNHSQKIGKIHNELKTKLFEMILDKRPELQEIKVWKVKKHTTSGSYIFHQRYQRRNLIHYVKIPSMN